MLASKHHPMIIAVRPNILKYRQDSPVPHHSTTLLHKYENIHVSRCSMSSGADLTVAAGNL